MSLKVSHLYKSYDKPIIQDFSYTFEDNHIYAITGPSGCGKTTLLYLLGFLEKKDQGSILIDDKEPKSIQKLYKHTIGFLFQNYALIENETIEQNLKMILKKDQDSLIPEVLKQVGIETPITQKISKLSGGQQQRIALARLLLHDTKIILCDEPTGALDYKTGKQILKLLEETARKEKMTVIIITHNAAIAPMADKVIKFKNGSASDIIINKKPKSIDEIEW